MYHFVQGCMCVWVACMIVAASRYAWCAHPACVLCKYSAVRCPVQPCRFWKYTFGLVLLFFLHFFLLSFSGNSFAVVMSYVFLLCFWKKQREEHNQFREGQLLFVAPPSRWPNPALLLCFICSFIQPFSHSFIHSFLSYRSFWEVLSFW